MKVENETLENPQLLDSPILENSYYKIILDSKSGAVKSIFDKELNKELVNGQSPYGFGQYVYVTSSSYMPVKTSSSGEPTEDEPEIQIFKANDSKLASITSQPYGTVATIHSTCLNTPQIETKIILFNNEKKIEFVNKVNKKKVYTKEGVYFAFPFAMDNPEFMYETQNGFINPAKDMLPGAGLGWFSTQHWIAAKQNSLTAVIVPVDAPLVTIGDIVRGNWLKEFGQRDGTIFSYVMSNYRWTNWVAGQGGEFTFRYVISSGQDLSPGHMSRLGWSEMTPVEIDIIRRNKNVNKHINSTPKLENSFVNIDSKDVILVNWKRALDKQGTIMRFMEVNGNSETVNVKIPGIKMKSVWQCDAVERNQLPISFNDEQFSFSIKPFQIVTIRINNTD